MDREVSHYVVTAHPPGGVLHTCKCNFMSSDREKQDVVVGKSRRLEVRQLKIDEEDEEAMSSPFPVVLSIPINGRIACLAALPLASHPTSLLFLATDQHQYAVIGYNADLPNYVETFASGNLKDEWNVMGDLADTGPLVAVDPHNRCIAMHLYDGLVTIFPIVNRKNILGPVFHARLEEKLVLQLTMLHHLDASVTPPHLCLLHQDARGAQHISTHVVDLLKSQLWSMTSMAGNQSMLGQHLEWLKKPRIDGGSSLLIPVPPVAAVAAAPSASATSTSATQQASGGVVILGQRQITFCALNHHKVMPIPPALILSWDVLPPDISGMPRFLLGDEFGNLHMLTLITQNSRVMALQLDTLGSCTLSNTLQYLDHGLVFCGSTLGDSQLVQIHDEPIPVEEEDMDDDAALELGETTYLSVEEEYTHLGPIVDFDLVPMTGSNRTEGAQSQVVTASGSSKSGSLRVVQNGTGMKEYAAVELGGIQNMWSLREQFDDTQDAYLVQSYVGETRVLGVSSVGGEDGDAMNEDDTAGQGDEMMAEEVGGTLEEVFLPGLESGASTLFVTNVVGDLFLQITESQLRLADEAGAVLDTMEPENQITVATANEAGQIAVALRGGKVLFAEINEGKLCERASKKMDREVSCLDINPFLSAEMCSASLAQKRGQISTLCAVGLWDDFTVRLLALQEDLSEVLLINLSTGEEDAEGDNAGEKHRSNRNNMMARSLCLSTLDLSSSSGNNAKKSKVLPGVDMLFVGLGDGTLVSFTVVQGGSISVQSKKEVSLGTQRINLVSLFNERGGSCVLATGDRPTVIYLAGASSANYNSKLCYSNVNISPADDGDTNDVSRPATRESISVNSATPFFNPLLFDAMGQDNYSLCIADDVNLRLGVIDDIQKLHVSTYRLGMAPRRVVHCPEGRLFAVGCIESGIKQGRVGGSEITMGNCIRFLDDTSFEDVHRIDLEPFEMILSMASATLRPYKPSLTGNVSGEAPVDVDDEDDNIEYKPVLIIGTAYAMHDEDEPTKGRIIVLSCGLNEIDGTEASRAVQTVAELEVRGGVYSMCQFYEGMLLATVNSKTQIFRLQDDGTGGVNLAKIGIEHHGHILSLFVSSRATKLSGQQEALTDTADGKESAKPEMLALVGDLMRSISLVQYYDEHETLEEVARDFNANWTTAVAMLTDDIYLGGENWNNLFVLKRNAKAQNEEVRCRLDTVGEFHLGEMCNKFMSGSLVMPSNSSTESSSCSGSGRRNSILTSPNRGSVSAKASSSQGTSRSRRPGVSIGSQTLFGTVDGTLGVILGLDGPTAAFFSCMQRALQAAVTPVGNFSHQQFRAFNAEQRVHPTHGFVDGDLIESFLDLDKGTMQRVVEKMNEDGGWEVDESAFVSNDKNDSEMKDIDRVDLLLEDVLAVVEEMTMLH